MMMTSKGSYQARPEAGSRSQSLGVASRALSLALLQQLLLLPHALPLALTPPGRRAGGFLRFAGLLARSLACTRTANPIEIKAEGAVATRGVNWLST